MKKRRLYSILIMMVFMALPMITLAQDDPLNDPIDPNDAPIDGGLGLLLAAGAAYGVKKYRDARKENFEPEMKGV